MAVAGYEHGIMGGGESDEVVVTRVGRTDRRRAFVVGCQGGCLDEPSDEGLCLGHRDLPGLA